MAELDPIIVRLRADAADFKSGLQDATGALQTFSSVADGQNNQSVSLLSKNLEALGETHQTAARSMRVAEGALLSMATAGTMTTQSLVRLGESFALFTGGPEVMLAITAAIVAVQAAMAAFGDETERATKKADDFDRALQSIGAHAAAVSKVMRASETVMALTDQLTSLDKQIKNLQGIAGQEAQIVLLEQQRAEVQEQLKNATVEQQSAEKALHEDTQKAMEKAGELTERQKQDQKDMIALNEQHLHGYEALAAHATALITSTAAWDKVYEGVVKHFEEIEKHQDAILKKNATLLPGFSVGAEGAAGNTLGSPLAILGLDVASIQQQVAAATPDINAAMQQLSLTFLSDKFVDGLKQGGRDAIRGLVDGMISGTGDFGKLLENAIKKMVEDAIIKTIVVALGIASPSKFGIDVGTNLMAGIAMGMASMKDLVAVTAVQSLPSPALAGIQTATSLSLNVNVPGPRSPTDLARDGQWQSSLRESLLVAEAQGFRLRGS
jgi:hypothetical protein